MDAGNLIVLHKTGGVIKKLSLENEKRIAEIIRNQKGPEIGLQKKGGAFVFEIDVKDQFEKPNKPARERSNQRLSL